MESDNMSEAEHKDFGRRLAFHTAPTLLGIKCASLVALPSAELDIEQNSEYFNKRAEPKGLKSKVLCCCKSRKQVLIYNEALMEKRFADPEIRRILSDYGYPRYFSVEQCLDRLSERIRKSSVFPHEIGIFLDYPLEDVVGFIENGGDNFKLCGAWKVYGSVENAKRTFANYNRCRKFLCNKLNEGADIYQALRIS